MTHDYEQFLTDKQLTAEPTGIEVPRESLNPMLFNFQKDLVLWCLARGRSAVFADCGLGKTPIQLDWARLINEHTRQPVLIVAPLAVSRQTVREGEKFEIDVHLCRESHHVHSGINITNYERIERFDPAEFGGVVLDESSILKSYTGKYRTALIEAFKDTPFRLACTATPAPNDFMELGNHSEFLGIMTRSEMLSMFFVHDGGSVQNWRLKGHAEQDFWRWMCSWAAVVQQPSDLGYSDDGFVLPPLNIHAETVSVSADRTMDGYLFPVAATTLLERRQERKASIKQRVSHASALANESSEPWVMWCGLNDESRMLTESIPGAVEVTGSHTDDHKERAMLRFADGEIRVLVTKPSIAGFGLNWQHCPNMAFVGLSDSYEQYYQAVRRCWRFGQTSPVNVHIVTAETEGNVVANVNRKESDAKRMADEMTAMTREFVQSNVKNASHSTSEYARTVDKGDAWTMHLGDCVDVLREMDEGSIDYTVYSPPFASLYTYSDSPRDMGNCKTRQEFMEHFEFLAAELYRVTRPGRLQSFHCMLMPTSKARDGIIGLHDFRGDLIRACAEAGWIYHSEVVIWKDPVTAMQRTKALGLLYKQLRKDAAMCRQGIPDYLVTMRKPGENTKPIQNTHEGFPVGDWQRYASPVWMDINASDTLQKTSAREEKDERHICPLQLPVIGRAIELWSAPDDLVLSPFAGIGSEGYVAIRKGRRFVGTELKRSYWIQAVKNLKVAAGEGPQMELDIFNAG
jgi:hypothetical protein